MIQRLLFKIKEYMRGLKGDNYTDDDLLLMLSCRRKELARLHKTPNVWNYEGKVKMLEKDIKKYKKLLYANIYGGR